MMNDMKKELLKAEIVNAGLYDKYVQYLGSVDVVEKRLEFLAEDIDDDDDVSGDIDYMILTIKKLLGSVDRKNIAKSYGLLMTTPIWLTGLGDGSVEWWINYNPTTGSCEFETISGYRAHEIAKVLRDLADLTEK